MSREEKILVTGAGGFIGGWLVETLYLSGHRNVRAGIHNWSGAARLARFPLEIVACDILEPTQISSALDGVTCVIHCAKGSDASIIAGTRNILDAAWKQEIKRFVHVSTTEVYGNAQGKIDETFPCQPTGNSYADSKIKAEELCWEYHAKGLPVTLIRPPIVFGPFSKTWTVNIALKLQSGNWGIFEDHGEGICNLLYVSDLVSAILLAAQSEKASGQAFNVNGLELLTWNQYFEKFNASLGLPSLKTIKPARASLRASVMEPIRSSAKFAKDHFEKPIRRTTASFGPAKQAMRFIEKSIKTAPRQTDFRLYNRKALYVADRAQEVLGFTPQFRIQQGLDLSISWLKQVGLVSSDAA